MKKDGRRGTSVAREDGVWVNGQLGLGIGCLLVI